MTTTIAIVNQKGGVGKTTTAVNLAFWLAQQGRRVCLVDFDVQGHAGRSLGVGKGPGLYRWLVDEEPLTTVAEPVRGHELPIDLVSCDKHAEMIKLHLSTMIGREYYIGQRLDGEGMGYDLVVLDLGPGSDLLHVGALIASDYLIIPSKLDFLALDGVMEVISTVRSLSRLRGVVAPGLIGVVPTMYDRQTAETSVNLNRLREAIGEGDLVLPPIPMDTRIREASSRGLAVWEYAPRCPGAIGYQVAGDARNGEDRVGGYLHLAEITGRFLK